MGIFSRFADIVNANINSLLDKAEEPEKMVRLIIQEMEDTLVEVRSTSARVLADKKELSRKIDGFRNEAENWLSKAELALTKGRDDLARQALAEKQKNETSSDALKQEESLLDEQLTKLTEEISQLQVKLQDAKTRQAALQSRAQTASSRVEVKSKLASEKVNDALNRFEQYERKIDGIQAQAESYDLGNKSLAQEFAELEAEDKIDSELSELKSKLTNKD